MNARLDPPMKYAVQLLYLPLCLALVLCVPARGICQDDEAWISPDSPATGSREAPSATNAGPAAGANAAMDAGPDAGIAAASGLVEQTESMDWVLGVMSASGEGATPENSPDPGSASALAMRRAVMQARKRLYEGVRKLNLDGSSTVAEFFTHNPDQEFDVSAFIRNSRIRDKVIDPDGRVSVRAILDVWGGLLGLLIPSDISFQTAVYNARSEQGASWTGLLVDARNVDVKPGLLPRILDANAHEIYGPSSMSRSTAMEKGLIAYVDDPSRAKDRVGANPLRVTAMDVSGSTGVNLKVGPSDAARILALGGSGNILQQCRVAVLTSPGTLETEPEPDNGLLPVYSGPALIPAPGSEQ